LGDAWQASSLVEKWPLEPDFRKEQLNPNRQILKELCGAVGVSTRDVIPKQSSTKSTIDVKAESISPSTSNANQTEKTGNKSGYFLLVFLIIMMAICLLLVFFNK